MNQQPLINWARVCAMSGLSPEEIRERALEAARRHGASPAELADLEAKLNNTLTLIRHQARLN